MGNRELFSAPFVIGERKGEPPPPPTIFIFFARSPFLRNGMGKGGEERGPLFEFILGSFYGKPYAEKQEEKEHFRFLCRQQNIF